MIVDAHAHVLNEDYGDVKKILEEYKKAGIDKGILVPGGMMDVRIMTKYITGEIQPHVETVPNNLVEDALLKYPDKFWGFYCINPLEGKCVLDKLENAKNRGFVGLKLAPMVHQFSLGSKIVRELAEVCGELQIPFYSHVVFSPAASTKKFCTLVEEFPKTTFILGHMGFGPADRDAIEFAYNHENMFIETSQGSFINLQYALKRLGPTKLIYGSEFPMYSPYIGLETIKEIVSKSKDYEDICGNNIVRILKGE